MAPKKRPHGGEGITKLLRDAGTLTKKQIEIRDIEKAEADQLAADPSAEFVIDEVRPFKPKIFNILEYIEQSWGLGMTLYPVQRFLVKLYYFMELDDREKTIVITDMLGQKVLYQFTEVEYLQFLYNEGRCNIKELDHERRQLILSIGRRGGKTTLSSIFASYEIYRLLNLYNPQQYYGFPNGNRIQIVSVATDKEQAGILFNEVTTHLAKCDYFKPHIANNTLSHIQFRTPYDIERFGPTARHQNGKFTSFNGKATLRVTFKSCVAKGLRGHSNAVVIMDEMAHYQDKGQSSAKDIYDAVTPSTATYSPKDPKTGMPMKRANGTAYPVESRIIGISSPLNKTGQFYDLFHMAMARTPGSENMLAIQAPTWEINPTVPAEFYQQKFHEDSTVFMTEFGAEFSDRVRAWIEREVDLMECVDPELRPQLMGIPRFPYQLGLDVGLMNDASAVSITGFINGRVELVYHEMWQAGVDWRESNPHLGDNYSTDYCKTLGDVSRIEFDEISDWIWKLTKRFFIIEGIFDRHLGAPLEQSLLKKGLTQFKCEYFSRELASRIYQNAKLLMFDKGLRLYDYPIPKTGGKKHAAHIQELLTLQGQQTAKNIVVVEAPKGAGFHDDFSDAYVRSVWLTSERMRNEKHVYGNNPISGSMAQSAMTSRRYQMMRARSHGGFGDRPSGGAGRKNAGMRPRSIRGVR